MDEECEVMEVKDNWCKMMKKCEEVRCVCVVEMCINKVSLESIEARRLFFEATMKRVREKCEFELIERWFMVISEGI